MIIKKKRKTSTRPSKRSIIDNLKNDLKPNDILSIQKETFKNNSISGIFKMEKEDVKDIEIDSLPKKQKKKLLQLQSSIVHGIKKKAKREGGVVRIQKRKLHSKFNKGKIKHKNLHKDIQKRNKRDNQKANKEINKYLTDGGSLKDEKAQIILDKLKPVKTYNRYKNKIQKIQNKQIETGTGNIPSILDFGITYKEARFITEFIKDYDEVKSALKAKIITKSMVKLEQERVINELLSNPNVSIALQAAVQDQIHRTLVTSDRTITQIAKMAFSDPLEIFKDDGTGRIKAIKDIPPSLRCCISEMTNTNIYDGRGDDRVVIGHLTKIKLHDSLKALTVLLKDIRDKTNKVGTVNFNQFNNYGPGGLNIKDRLKDLSDQELDILVKLSNQGVESTLKTKELPAPGDLNIEDSSDEIIELARAKNLEDGTQLYHLNDLKDIEQDNI